MEMDEIIEQAEENIRTAVADYRRHTQDTEILDSISEKFITRLAEDSSHAKQELRSMFSQSPVWDSKLDALVINGTRTHDPDYGRIESLAYKILSPARCGPALVDKIVDFFAHPDKDWAQQSGMEAIAFAAPKAYAPGKKLSRVFKAVCEALGVADETAGSEYQKLYAQFADELAAKKIGFKLFVSINPAHFLTMSNPKNDRRGNTLTSCHSLNSTQYAYNVGCTGYARDCRSFIVFTVADPSDRETLNNRKTTRQIFAYKPGAGLLLQSRFYNTSGGVYGAVEDSKLYRDLVQREISAIERVPNLWKTFLYCGSGRERFVEAGEGFGGYPDWIYPDFDAKISIRADHEADYDKSYGAPGESMTVGTWGLCIHCATETDRGVYCPSCDDGSDREFCACCEEYYDSEEMTCVRDAGGNEAWVCERCRDRHYTYCDCCGEYYLNEYVHSVEDARADYCENCIENHCEQCEECGEWHMSENMVDAVSASGSYVRICVSCRDDRYVCCEGCGSLVRGDDLTRVFNETCDEFMVCPRCARDSDKCEGCGRKFRSEDLQDGLCPDCYQENEMEEPA